LVAFAALAHSQVQVLTADNFDSVVDGSLPAFIEFYAPWCGHCKKLAPEYDVVGDAFTRFKSKVVVAKVDCDSEKELCGKHGIQGYPTLKWFPKGDLANPQPYSGGRTAADIISFINQKAGTNAIVPRGAPSAVVDLTDATFDKIVLDSKKGVFVEFYAPWCGHCKSLAPDYEKLGKAFANEEEVVIARIDADAQKEKAREYGVSGFPTLKWFPKNDKSGLDYDSGRSLDELVSFINEKAGSKRLNNGLLSESAGLIPELDAIAKKLKDSKDKATVAAEGAKAASANGSKSAKIYASFLEKAASDPEFVAKETARLERMTSSGSLSSQKLDEFTIRLNILRQF